MSLDGPTATNISPANVEAATLFKDNKQEYERRVKVSQLWRSVEQADIQITVEQSWVDDEELQNQADSAPVRPAAPVPA